MNAGQYEGILNLLAEIRDRMPEPPAPVAKPLVTHHLDGTSTTGPAPVRTGWPYNREGPAPVSVSPTREADKLAGAVAAFAAMERAAKGWAEGGAQNEIDMGRRDRKPSDQQPFVLADILNMIDEAAREVGVAPVYSERSKPL